MVKNYFKTALRNLRKNKLYSAINISGLSIGLTDCLLIGIYIGHEWSYDKFNANAPRIARVTMEYSISGTISTAATTGTKVGPQFKRMFPAIKEYVRTFIGSRIVKTGGKLFQEPRILFADQPFFNIFSYRILEGNGATALDAPNKIVISQSMAKKYFGPEEGLGKILTLDKNDFTVSAICEDAPQNAQIKFDFVTQFLNWSDRVKIEKWDEANWITYLLLNDEKDLGRVQKQIRDYTNSPELKKEFGFGNDYLTFHLEPLTKVHLYSPLAGFEPNGSITYVYMFAAIALLILIIACANYTNLSTAQSAGRGGEIGMRKVMGASKRQVFLQFMGESMLISCISSILAFIMAILLIPYFNTITGKQFTSGVLLQPMTLLALTIFTVLVSFFAGLYPAMVLAGTQIMGVLKKGFNFTGGNNTLRKILIVAQFGISVFLIIYTVIILQQMHYMQTKNLGYKKDHIVVLPIAGTMMQNFQNTKDAIAHVPGVEGVTAS
ncbi:MAG TPA: ABC transporter permease, partial [Puia sp.]|nr:ABC transporter permease [Puia sp.]